MPKTKTITAEQAAADDATGTAPAKKIDTVVALLKRADGATLAEMVEATGWLPHTTRAALTGLRKKGHAVDRRKRNDVTCYHLEG
jgi:hypothetical protein